MRNESMPMTLVSLVLLVSVVAPAQQAHKTGLWQIATTTRIQQPGDPPGNFASKSGPSAEGGLPVCMTQELIKNYGVILPPSLRDCVVSNVVQTADTFHADMTCKGGYNGVGSIETTWTDEDHVVGKVRFAAKSKDNDDSSKVQSLVWSQEASAIFKSSDCGSVRPRKIPVKTAPSEKP